MISLRLLHAKYLLLTGILILGLGSCSKNDHSTVSNETGFQNFNLFPGRDHSDIQLNIHRIDVRVPDSILSGTGLTADFTLSRGASAAVDGIPQQIRVTRNDFEKELRYTVTAADRQTRQEWTVQATNNNYSLSWGLGHFINHFTSNDRAYNWYIDQGNSGEYASVNCGPASVTMAIHWADSGFTKTALEARQTYQTAGGWWYTSDVNLYLNKYSIMHAIIGLSDNEDSFRTILGRQLDHQQIIILCLDMDHVRQSANGAFRVDKFYPTTPGWGHFIVLKGYHKVDQEVFFESYDPYSFGSVNADNSLRGQGRFYRYEDLANACKSWWNYAFVIARKGEPLNMEAIKRKLDPALVPVAHNF